MKAAAVLPLWPSWPPSRAPPRPLLAHLLCRRRITHLRKSATLVPLMGVGDSNLQVASSSRAAAAIAAVAASALAAVAAVAVMCLCACLCACVRCVLSTCVVGVCPRFWESGRGLHYSRKFRTSRYRLPRAMSRVCYAMSAVLPLRVRDLVCLSVHVPLYHVGHNLAQSRQRHVLVGSLTSWGDIYD